MRYGEDNDDFFYYDRFTSPEDIFIGSLKLKILLKIFQRINMSSICRQNQWDMHYNGGKIYKQHKFDMKETSFELGIA